MSDDLTFSSLKFKTWRQFEEVDINFHPSLTVITGANGAGKSSILRVLSRHFGFNRPFLATPITTTEGNGFRYLTGLFGGFFEKFTGIEKRQRSMEVGQLMYSNGVTANLTVPGDTGIQYELSFSQQLGVLGTHIDSHQAVSTYQQVSQIPMTAITAETAFAGYNQEVSSRYQGGYSGVQASYRLKEALISMALLGEGNSSVPGNKKVFETYTSFIEVLRSILPDTLGFITLAIRPPEVVLVTRSGEFLIDAASGGVATLIDIAWRLHTFSRDHKRFVVTMDEPENHLHPSMQRSLMGRLIATFPNVQFIVATHSPFIVSSVRDAHVYVLRYRNDEDREVEGFAPEAAQSRVISERLSWMSKAGSANDILREVLGVPATMPEWAEASLEAIVRDFRDRPITEETLGDLRSALDRDGFDEYYPDALSSLVKSKNDLTH